jgi:hypothetical protein
MPSPRTTIPKEHVSPTSQKHHVSFEHVTGEQFFEREKTITLDYIITFTHMSIPSTKNTYKTAYTKGHVKP